MSYTASQLDLELCFVMRAMWAFLTYAAFCLFCNVCLMYAVPSYAVGMYQSIPEMAEHLLAGCVVTVGLGSAFQYLGGR